MDVLGAYVKVKDDRFVAGFALTHNGELVDSWTFSAPTGHDHGGQLGELSDFAFDRLRQSGADRLAILFVDVPRGKAKPKRLARRAEGAIAAAAGRASIPAKLWSDRAFTGGGAVQSRVDELCSQLAQVPAQEERKRAAAAALASEENPDA